MDLSESDIKSNQTLKEREQKKLDDMAPDEE